MSINRLSLIAGLAAAIIASGASAQSINLTGVYKCIQMCRGACRPLSPRMGPN